MIVIFRFEYFVRVYSRSFAVHKLIVVTDGDVESLKIETAEVKEAE